MQDSLGDHPTPIPLLAWLKVLRQAVCDVTRAVSTLAGVDMSIHSMHAHLKPAMTARRHIALLTSPALVLPIHNKDRPSIRSEYTSFVADFVRFLATMVPQICKRGPCLGLSSACSVGSADGKLFWDLWSLLDAGCQAFSTLTAKSSVVWLHDAQPVYPSLCDALTSLLTWILSISRSPAWRLMRPEHGLHMRNDELLTMLCLPLGYLTESSSETAQSCINAPNFDTMSRHLLPLVCCIATEQFGTAPLVVPTTRIAAGMKATTYMCDAGLQAQENPAARLHVFIDSLTSLIYNFAINDKKAEQAVHLSRFTAPAVIQLLKVGLMTQTRMQPPAPLLVKCSIWCLEYVLGLSMMMLHGSPDHALSEIDQACNTDKLGLPLHLNPVWNEPALETDRLLLHSLSVYMHSHVSLTVPCSTLQTLILQNWHFVGRSCPASAASMVKIHQSVVGLAKQCTAHGLILMQQFQGPKCPGKTQGRARTARQKQLRKDAESDAAKLSSFRLVLENEEGMQAISSLMLSISDLSFFNSRSTVVSNTGE